MTVSETPQQLDESIRQEGIDWFDRYTRAWDARDLETLAAMVDPALTGRMVMMDGETVWEATYDADIDGSRGFFAFVARHQVVNDHQLYDVVFRAPDEGIIITRKTVRILDGDDPRAVTQFAIETLRRNAHGEWRLIRYWAEKARHGD